MAKSDCARLIQILNRTPLRGRKGRDFAIWSAAIEWWIAGDATRYEKNRDWEAAEYLKKRLSVAKGYSPTPAALNDTGPPGLEGDWGGFFAGFFTAEGSFSICRRGEVLVPQAQITLRADNLPLLRELAHRTAIGSIYALRLRDQNRLPVAMWMARKKVDLLQLVSVFDRHPLRGRKAREYAIWRQAVLVYAATTSVAARHPQLSELRRELTQMHQYATSPVA